VCCAANLTFDSSTVTVPFVLSVGVGCSKAVQASEVCVCIYVMCEMCESGAVCVCVRAMCVYCACSVHVMCV